MRAVMILVGVPGTGKSTILQAAVERYPELKVINYGAQMVKEASAQRIDKDMLRKMPIDQQEKIGIAAAKSMANEMTGITCVDTHALIKTPLGYRPGIPKSVLEILSPQMIVMVESKAELIYQRRHLDETRNRDKESIEEIEYHQQSSRAFSLSCCAMTGALFVPIRNDNDPLEACEQLVRVADALKSIVQGACLSMQA